MLINGKTIRDILENGDDDLIFGGYTHQYIDGEITLDVYRDKLHTEFGIDKDTAREIAEEVRQFSEVDYGTN